MEVGRDCEEKETHRARWLMTAPASKVVWVWPFPCGMIVSPVPRPPSPVLQPFQGVYPCFLIPWLYSPLSPTSTAYCLYIRPTANNETHQFLSISAITHL